MLWRRIVQPLRCWRVLIPLHMELGFDNAVTSLEGLAWRPEQIEWAQPLGRLATDHRSPTVSVHPP
jgi:hypothetical protein